MAGISNNPSSPHQRVINLMYLVSIAMMALNVSSEVLDSFELVRSSLRTSIDNSPRRDKIITDKMEAYYQENPQKVGEWALKTREVKKASDSLYTYIQDLKVRIVKVADGENTNVNSIGRKDGLEAASRVMPSPVSGEGKKLRAEVDRYRVWMDDFVEDSAKTAVLETNLSTTPPHKAGINTHTWEETLFESIPVAAAVTLLTKIQSDVCYAEGEVLSNLLNSVDVGDYRVNQITAQVIPESQIVMQGSQYKANIVLSAVDSTKRPTIYVNGKELPYENKEVFTANTEAAGTFLIKGYIEMPNSDGNIMRRDFESEHFVIEPVATVTPTLMNVLHAGIANPMRIAVPGVPSGNVTATMTNGTLTRNKDGWEARPSKVGTETVITVNARMADGRNIEMAKTTFRVHALSDSLPYIEYKDQNGNIRKFKGGMIVKRSLVEADGILTAIDNDLLNVKYTVLRFELTFFDSMGNAIPEVAEGTNFPQRQKNYTRNLSKGKRFYITRVVAKGSDGIECTTPTIEVIVD